jgi:hypothetical protein
MKRRVLVATALLGSLSVACHTITEDLPSRPSSVSDAPVPTIVISVPVPKPTPVPTPTPQSTPIPQPTPGPGPTPEPNSGGQNTNPVVRVACSVYFVECDGQVVPGSKGATSARSGCRVHLDATTKDANNEHTYRTGPQWTFSNPGMIERSGQSAWNPAITGLGRHYQQISAAADGVRCATFGISFE